MLILAIETSCDETSAAVVENGWKVHSNIIASQVEIHAKTGGVIPEVAAREHVLKIIPVIDQALKEANKTLNDIDAIAVTSHPGLISSLLIGTNTASTLALLNNKILIPVNHIHGHIYSNWLSVENPRKIKFPILILTVSGGHNEIIYMKDHHEFEIIGETRDDAAGEAFDKVARMLGLGYPGGPEIAKAAKSGNPKKIKFPIANLGKNSFDFSFSGLKTAVLYEIKQKDKTQQYICDIASCFQEAVTEALSQKLILAAQKYKVEEIHLAGGVSANIELREKIIRKIQELDSKSTFRHPEHISYCTDNAAMIASAAYFQYKKNPEKYKEWRNIIAKPN
ncbi:tRNA (adenosine(37)-N6)-threonylcarbamoyltransferase complex transferase subunit TsaD [Candidatus Peregrinibacteria bacterium RIFOXYA2_FULL_33_7]|nr:MAG: glycoprotease family metalloendopeptidase, O-sialoglycoprotein endopeptidase [Candidatus Peregrinibacteria bacterium GW2011_GWC2_33_13]OGJ48775.1 MAG: tRNA (adenosine(37)-N6)-threonylcarbamoyltransferase complex transferase subunit TsaD [Candidatus Peregrinibacteria bacterium RIFOXYA2_FULL_33_7]